MPSQANRAVQLSASGPLQPAAGQPPHLSAASPKSLHVPVSSSVMQQSSVALSLTTSPFRPQQPVADDGRRTIAKVPPPDSDDEDEVEIIQAFCGRPTRSGRIPRPAVRPLEETVEQVTGSIVPSKSSTTDSTVNMQTDVCETASRTLSKPVVSLSQGKHMNSSTQPSAGLQSTSHSYVAEAGTPAAASAVPPVDLNNLPPGYFVVVEMPSSGMDGGHQQALYHIFAVDEGAEASSGPPPVSARSQSSYSSAPCQQHAVLSNGDAVHQSVVCSQPVSISSADAVSYGNVEQVTDQTSVMYSQTSVCSATAATVPWYNGRDVLTGGQSSSCQDIAQICDELSGLVDCDLTATKQADGTVIIQTTPTVRCLRQPPARVIPRPGGTQLVPRHTSMNLVPRLPSAEFGTRQPVARQVTPSQPCAAEILLDATTTGQDDDGAQYVNIVVEECDDFEREEYVI